MTLSRQQKAFVETLRKQGIRYLESIIIHNGYPQQIGGGRSIRLHPVPDEK